MAGFYQAAYVRFPEFLKRRINPLEEGISQVAWSAAAVAGQGRVLDAGAGEARFRDFFDGARYVAVGLAVGDANWDYTGIDLVADLQVAPFAEGCFDVALNLQVLEHIAKPEQLLQEIHRVLRPGGQLFLTAPQGWAEHQAPHDYYRFTRFSLRQLLATAGFEEITIEPMGGYFHYLGHRMTYLPKTLFVPLKGWKRALFFPIELVSLFFFCFLFPLICFYMDRLDQGQELTLGYQCRAKKAEN